MWLDCKISQQSQATCPHLEAHPSTPVIALPQLLHLIRRETRFVVGNQRWPTNIASPTLATRYHLQSKQQIASQYFVQHLRNACTPDVVALRSCQSFDDSTSLPSHTHTPLHLTHRLPAGQALFLFHFGRVQSHSFMHHTRYLVRSALCDSALPTKSRCNHTRLGLCWASQPSQLPSRWIPTTQWSLMTFRMNPMATRQNR